MKYLKYWKILNFLIAIDIILTMITIKTGGIEGNIFAKKIISMMDVYWFFMLYFIGTISYFFILMLIEKIENKKNIFWLANYFLHLELAIYLIVFSTHIIGYILG